MHFFFRLKKMRNNYFTFCKEQTDQTNRVYLTLIWRLKELKIVAKSPDFRQYNYCTSTWYLSSTKYQLVNYLEDVNKSRNTDRSIH